MRHIFTIMIAALIILFYPTYGFTAVKEIVSEGAYNMGDGETPSVAESRALLNAKRVLPLSRQGLMLKAIQRWENLN